MKSNPVPPYTALNPYNAVVSRGRRLFTANEPNTLEPAESTLAVTLDDTGRKVVPTLELSIDEIEIEAIAISLVGSLIGVSGAIGLVLLVGVASGLAVAISWFAVVLALIFACVIGVGFGYYPARRAALLLPIEALRYE